MAQNLGSSSQDQGMSSLHCQFADSTPRFATLRAEPSTWLTTRQNRHDMEADSRMRKCNMCEAAACPFLAPHFGALSEVLCEDGKYVKAGRARFQPVEMPRVLEGTSLQDWSCMKGGHGQRAQCPANSPVMCARQSCHDLRVAKSQPKSKQSWVPGGADKKDYCCSTSCHQLDGPRPCAQAGQETFKCSFLSMLLPKGGGLVRQRAAD